MKWNYNGPTRVARYDGKLFMLFSCIIQTAVGGVAYDPSTGFQWPSALDKPFLREPCLAVVEELDYEPSIDLVSQGSDTMSDNQDSWLYCETPGGYFYKVPTTDPAWIEDMVQGGTLVSGETELNLPPDTMVNEQLGTLEWSHSEVAAPGLVQISGNSTNHTFHRRRRLVQVTGTKTVLAVRVFATDQQNTFDEATLRNEVFGTGNTNLKTQFAKCSFDQLIFIPTDDRSGNTLSIVGGVVTVTVNHLASAGDSVIRNAVTTVLKNDFGVSSPVELADHVMYCLPPRAMTGIAYAYINSWLSVYKDVWGLYVSAQMHEFGHNLNLAHATDFKFLSHNSARSEYDDKTGLMGYSYSHKEFPKMCFNPAKSWQLKWYSNKEATYVPTCEKVTMKVGGIIDYEQNQVNTVLLQFNQRSVSGDYYLTYNARTSFNRETQEGGNKVVIDAQGGNGRSYSKSTLEARLEVGESFAMRNFNGVTGDTVVVRFVERGGFNNREATIAIDWIPKDTSICDINVLTHAPTGFPTKAPTGSPTLGPSALPTVRPSGSPTTSPTMKPTGEPSRIPTLSPTLNPTSFPSNGPSASPTKNPTTKPTLQPSLVPSTLPSLIMSESPTVRPTRVPSPSPTKSPSSEPTTMPSNVPSPRPTSRPSEVPTTPPTANPSQSPTSKPSPMESSTPSRDPTLTPTIAPSASPTLVPTTKPSDGPTMAPICRPTGMPSKRPTVKPTVTPSTFPTRFPTPRPTWTPSKDPTGSPSVSPSNLPTHEPSWNPSPEPTALPTMNPSQRPTSMPSIPPTQDPTPIPTLRPTLSPPVTDPSCRRWYWFIISDCKGQGI